jgi:hypothetical protein
MIRSFLFAVSLSVLAVPVLAHHGFGTFDLQRSVTFDNAVLVEVDFINPHSWMYFDVVDENGESQRHRCEMRSAHVLRRSGWSPELFPAGAVVTLVAAPDREDERSCYLNTIRFADGGHMDRYGQYVKGEAGDIEEVRGAINEPDLRRRPRRMPSGAPYLAGDWAAEQVVMADPRGAGGGLVPLSRLEELDANEGGEGRAGGGREGRGAAGRGGRGGGGRGGRGGDGPRLYNGTALTARGEREAAAFERMDNPRFSCETTSVVFDWTFDGPVNRIIQTNDTIVIKYGQMNLERVVHLNMAEHPDDITPSRAGHSIGRWEDDVLVVDTVGFAPGVLNAPVRHSNQLHVVERFELNPETYELTRSYVAEDPVYLQGQYTGSDRILPANASYALDDCEELGFIDFSEEVAQ